MDSSLHLVHVEKYQEKLAPYFISWHMNTVSLISHYETCSFPLKNTWFRIFTIEENIKRSYMLKVFPKLRDKRKIRQFLIDEKQLNVHKQPDVFQCFFWCFTPSLEKVSSAGCRNTPSIFNCHPRHPALCLTHHFSFTRSKDSNSFFKAIFKNLCMCPSKKKIMAIINSPRLYKANF